MRDFCVKYHTFMRDFWRYRYIFMKEFFHGSPKLVLLMKSRHGKQYLYQMLPNSEIFA